MKAAKNSISNGDVDISNLSIDEFQGPLVNYFQLLEELPIAIYTCDANGYLKQYNQAAVNLFGNVPQSVKDIWRGAKMVENPTSFKGDDMAINASLKNKVLGKELIIKRRDGLERTVKAFPQPVYDRYGRVIGGINIVIDLTKEKGSERALKVIETRFSQFIQNLPIGVFTCDKAGRITFFNEIAVKLWGFRPTLHDENLKFCGFKTIKPSGKTNGEMDRTPMSETILQERSFHNLDVSVERIDGTEFQASINCDPLYDEGGRASGAICLFQDITNFKTTENALRESEFRYRQLVQGVPGALYTCDAEGRITLYNAAAAKLWGREPEIGKDLWCGSWKIYYNNGEPMPLEECPMAIALKEGRPVIGEEIIVERPDGVRLNIAPHPQPFFDTSGKVAGAVNMLVDITALKAAHTALLEKNRELEQFVYVASHDLREPLNTINSFVGLLENEITPTPETAEYLNFIRNSSSRMLNLITDLLDYSKIGRHSKLTMVDFNQVVGEMLRDMNAAIESKKAVVEVGQLPKTLALPTEIRLLFQNLLCNAIKFQRPDANPVVKINAVKEPLSWHFTVEDNGIGIDKEYGNKLFVIFQRLHSREEFEGTGIGLAHCKKIVDLHKGEIWFESVPGEGSTFHFTISEMAEPADVDTVQ